MEDCGSSVVVCITLLVGAGMGSMELLLSTCVLVEPADDREEEAVFVLTGVLDTVLPGVASELSIVVKVEVDGLLIVVRGGAGAGAVVLS
jgi:hypothetical protein